MEELSCLEDIRGGASTGHTRQLLKVPKPVFDHGPDSLDCRGSFYIMVEETEMGRVGVFVLAVGKQVI